MAMEPRPVVVKFRRYAVPGMVEVSHKTVTADSFAMEPDGEEIRAVFRNEGRVVLTIPMSNYLDHWGLD